MTPQELKGFLRQHVSVDELWKVAHGEIKYADFKSSQKAQDQAQAPPAPAPAPAPKQDVQVPEELVSGPVGATSPAHTEEALRMLTDVKWRLKQSQAPTLDSGPHSTLTRTTSPCEFVQRLPYATPGGKGYERVVMQLQKGSAADGPRMPKLL